MQFGEIEFIYTPAINFAFQQNHVPVVKEIKAKNVSGRDISNITVTLSCDPDFSIGWQQKIDKIGVDEALELSSIDLPVSAKYLSELTERVLGNITLSITTNDENILKEIYPIDLLAYDQWNGMIVLPELLSTFVTPNHPHLPKIIRRASEILNGWTGNPSFDEYQTRNPDRVKKQMAAIYEAISEMKIVYCSVPASFEEMGQRIRMCDTIFSTGMANCLDLSLLYASCLEAVGIHPLIIILKGHAFAGGWLINECFADPMNDDSSLITKRTASGINEVMLIESTYMNAGGTASFDEASASANFKMVNETDFLLFIDVKRSRFSGIRPLPLRIKTEGGWDIIEEKPDTRSSELPGELLIGPKLVNVEKIDVSKQTIWERKLLDLTLRNSLLNLRITKNTIQFIGLDLSHLEDALAGGDELQILPRPTDWDNPLRSSGVYQSLNQTDPILDLVRHEFSQKRLRAYASESELLISITSVYRASRLAIEENGANTLYIALGLLKWYETNASERPRYAPLLLIPVEIKKKSAQKGFIIRTREEETMMNVTLLEMLRQDFGINIGGPENLPKDSSGVDVKTVFNIIRQAVMARKGWDVEEQCFLSTFSFSKFILWNDIHNNVSDLLKNKVVKSLVSGKLEWEPQATGSLQNPDKEIHPSDISLPISSDSSQLDAVITSVRNESFVLHGPPGTGKSQTITNIIANALYHGKKVLFVSAKKAALDVVHTRLNAIGIGPFCLELHSNKSKKSTVLEQLKRSTEVTKIISPVNYKIEAARLYDLRVELGEYVNALHKKYFFGFSLFELFTKYCELKRGNISVFFSVTDIQNLTPERLQTWSDNVEEIRIAAGICLDIAHHSLKEVQTIQYNQQLKNECRQILDDYLQLLSEFESQEAKTISILKIDLAIETRSKAEMVTAMIDQLLLLRDTPASLFAIEHAEQNLSRIISITEHGMKRDEIRNELSLSFLKTVLTINAQQLLNDWNIAERKWFLPKFLKQNSITKILRGHLSTGRVNKRQIVNQLEKIIEYQQEQEVIDKASDLPAILQFLWKNGECDWKQLVDICNTIISINRLAIKLDSAVSAAKWRDRLSGDFYQGSKIFLDERRERLGKYGQLLSQISSKENRLADQLKIDFSKLEDVASTWTVSLSQHTQRWLMNIESLKDWISWNQVRSRALAEGLHPVINPLGNGDIRPQDIVTEYLRGLYKACADYIIDDNENLSSFNGKLFEEKIRRFREISNLFEKLTKEELFARLATSIPDFTKEAAQSSEIGILQRTIKNNGRGMSIRKLYDAIPNLLPRLAPCMLMSPISVAQYFDTTTEKFDLLVFDEASQLPTCEAVGAIARAGNVIVVGDPKQMPPTNFFTTNNIDEENIDKEDLESILDDCLALSMPSRYLLWHYRSKHESLIAFSNAKYYDNKLLTFPSTDDIISKVSFIPVKGYYDKGKTRQNSFEAKAIVEEVIRRLSDPELLAQSMGIVTFSVVQQFLVEDLLNEVFKSRPDLEKLANESEEPLFIKNLENVQGDERDIILFSVGYGPDKDGKVSLNFGPINREGGWRRLNVAVSRARYEMLVYSTLRSDQIDLARTSSQGVEGLKAFLAYAEKGRSALPARPTYISTASSAFAGMLAEKIKQHGYDVHTAIGCSTYKIDIGVIDPANKNRYLLGILCDGDNYRKAATTRDREITQPQVLEKLGWNIYKIWSADWWENPERSIMQVIEIIKKRQQGEHGNEATFSTQETHEASVKAETISINDNFEIASMQTAVAPAIGANKGTKYENCNLEIVLASSSEEFLFPYNRKKIIEQINNVLQTEAPISKALLCKRVLSAWGISRNGARLSSYFENLFSEMQIRNTTAGNNVFFWKQEQHPSVYSTFRYAENEDQKRDPDDLPPEEIANAVKMVLQEQIGLSREDLVRETAKLFGFLKVGANVEFSMSRGIAIAINRGHAKEQNGRISLT